MRRQWVLCVLLAVLASPSRTQDDLLKPDTILSRYYTNEELVSAPAQRVSRSWREEADSSRAIPPEKLQRSSREAPPPLAGSFHGWLPGALRKHQPVVQVGRRRQGGVRKHSSVLLLSP